MQEAKHDLRGEVRVATGARLEATVYAHRVVIEGEFEGRVTADVLEFGPTAQARGTFLADAVIVREGAFVVGSFNLPEEPAVEEAVTEEAAPAAESSVPDGETSTPEDAEEMARLAEAELASTAVN